jgi:all-trans-8'-apo-beta-carotenal 15,15'-oxygenase
MKSNTFHSGLRALNEEFSYRAGQIEGALPAWLRGTFFRNGPGRLEVGAQRFGHWFDGDGMLCKFAFTDDGVQFANRYVRTPKYVRETAINAIDCRGFGTQRPGGLLKNFLRPPANPANTSVVWHGNHLLALNEGGRPFELDPATLETLGEFNYSGELSAFNMFSAHGKIHPRTGHYYNFGMGVHGITRHGMQPGLSLYRISPAGKLEKKVTLAVDCFPFCHDFALTDKHAIFFLSSIRVENLGGIILGSRTMADSVRFDPLAAMQVIVVDLHTFEVVLRSQTQAGAAVHFGNAWEDQQAFHVDAMFIDNFDANEQLKNMWGAERIGGGEFLRYRIEKASGLVSAQVACAVECEFPHWDSRKTGVEHSVTYAAAVIPNGDDSFFNAIIKVRAGSGNIQLQKLPAGYFSSEPVFAPRPSGDAEDDGVLLSVVYNANSQLSELWLLDAADISQVLAKVLLPHHIPHQFHGFFTPQLFG